MPGLKVRFACKDDIPALMTLIAEFADYERSLKLMSMTGDKLLETLFGNRLLSKGRCRSQKRLEDVLP